jgi:hypothetical protein
LKVSGVSYDINALTPGWPTLKHSKLRTSRPDLDADQIVIRFLFMPILREELTAFAATHNAHPIRVQKNRLQHVPGAPDELYRQDQYGFAIDVEVLTAMEDTLPNYGKYMPINWR